MARPDVQAFMQWQQSMRGDPKMKAILDAIKQGTKAKAPTGTPTFPPQAGNTFYDSPFSGRMLTEGTGGNLPIRSPQPPVIDVTPTSATSGPKALGEGVGQKLLTGATRGKSLRDVLGMLAKGGGAALTGASAYGMARELAGPKAASFLGGPLAQLAELGIAKGNSYANDTSSLPEAPQGPGLPMNSSNLAPDGPREEFTPEFAQQLMQAVKSRGNTGAVRRTNNPFTFNDPTEMGPEMPEEMAETVDGFPEELQERQPTQMDFSMGGITPEDPTLDPSIVKAGKKRNPLMRAIMGVGRGLGKVF